MGNLPAQPYSARNLSIQHGLPEYYVSGLVQDKAGFIWVATRDGLARYDGREFKVFRHKPFERHSLANNVILSLESLSDTSLLIRFEDYSLQLFNPVTERFTDLITKQQREQSRLTFITATLSPDRQVVWGRLETDLIAFNIRTKQRKIYPLPQQPAPETRYQGNTFLLSTQQQLYAPFPGKIVSV